MNAAVHTSTSVHRCRDDVPGTSAICLTTSSGGRELGECRGEQGVPVAVGGVLREHYVDHITRRSGLGHRLAEVLDVAARLVAHASWKTFPAAASVGAAAARRAAGWLPGGPECAVVPGGEAGFGLWLWRQEREHRCTVRAECGPGHGCRRGVAGGREVRP